MNRRIKRGASRGCRRHGVRRPGDRLSEPSNLYGAAQPEDELHTSIPTRVIDKVDLLFDIDNSASMGDKQAYLAKAIPDLITRLVHPELRRRERGTMPVRPVDGRARARAGRRLEFPPVHDMHIGIVSSSLGARLGDACDATTRMHADGAVGPISRHNDDQAHLLNRSRRSDEPARTTPRERSPTRGRPTTSSTGSRREREHVERRCPAHGAGAGHGDLERRVGLSSDFQQLVVGVHEFGCGIESQLETWYRFLIQPDPYASLGLDNGGKLAQWVGRRHDDPPAARRLPAPRLAGGRHRPDRRERLRGRRSRRSASNGWNFMSTEFQPPRGTSVVRDQPGRARVHVVRLRERTAATSDPSMQRWAPYTATDANDWGYDLEPAPRPQEAEVRRLGRSSRSSATCSGSRRRRCPTATASTPARRPQRSPSGYVGMNDCTNPLYAASLPSGGGELDQATLCKLAPGPRTTDLVFFAHIGGVPPRSCTSIRTARRTAR